MLTIIALSLFSASQVLAGSELLFAIHEKDAASIDAYIEAGINMNYCAEDHTPLVLATIEKDLTTIQKLVKAGARLDFPSGSTLPLHQAILISYVAGVDYYLDQGAPINQRDPNGKTPLDCAKKALKLAKDLNYNIAESQTILRAILGAMELEKKQKEEDPGAA